MVPLVPRTGEVVEPMISEQWFLAMSKPAPEGSRYPGKSLSDLGLEAVQENLVNIFPEQWQKVYKDWLSNIQDWCLSRQLWWGHQIPAWYDDKGNVYVAHTEEEAQQKAGEGVKLHRDEDVLDTWFSSALVPFSTLINDPKAFDIYLPSSVLVTGYDILFFWVARMIMMTRFFTGRVPFKNVYIHGLVRDAEGNKMSKSEGNTLDPLDIIQGVDLESLVKKNTTGLRQPEKAPIVERKLRKHYPEGINEIGADALRFTMAAYATLGRNVNFDVKRADGYRNFCNKLWNATRFVLMNIEGKDCGLDPNAPMEYSAPDQWIWSEFERTVQEVCKAFEDYRLDNAANAIYSFIWNQYCDWYLELSKVQLNQGNEAVQRATRHTLVTVLEQTLRLAHPIIPFITEELWQHICDRKEGESIMIAQLPGVETYDEALLAQIETAKEIISGVRSIRLQKNIPNKDTLELQVIGQHNSGNDAVISKLANLSAILSVNEKDATAASFLVGTTEYAVPLGNNIDVEAELKKQEEELKYLRGFLKSVIAKLSNERFVNNAPAQVVEMERKKQSDAESKIKSLEESIAALKK